MKLSSLNTGDVVLLTEILQLKTSEKDPIRYNNRISALTEALPSRLKSTNFLETLLPKRRVLDGRPFFQGGPLCSIHTKLDAAIVHRVYTLIALEVGVRLNGLARRIQDLSPEQQGLIKRLRALHAIWYEAEKFEMLFCESARETGWTFQGNKCAACTLARLAGDLRTVLDLALVVASHTSKSERRRKPRLVSWLSAWLNHHKRDHVGAGPRKTFVDLVYDNETRGIQLKELRKQFSRERKAARRSASRPNSASRPRRRTTLQAVPEDEQIDINRDDDEDRLVSRICDVDEEELADVNLDAALLSTDHLPDMNRFRSNEPQRSTSNLSRHPQSEARLEPPPLAPRRRSVALESGSRVSHQHSRAETSSSKGHGVPAESESVHARHGERKPPSSVNGRGRSISSSSQTPRQAPYSSALSAAKSYSNVLDHQNPFSASNCSSERSNPPPLPQRTRPPVPPGVQLAEFPISLPGAHSQPDSSRSSSWTDASKSSTLGGYKPPSSRSTLTGYALASPARNSESSVLEQYANYRSPTSAPRMDFVPARKPVPRPIPLAPNSSLSRSGSIQPPGLQAKDSLLLGRSKSTKARPQQAHSPPLDRSESTKERPARRGSISALHSKISSSLHRSRPTAGSTSNLAVNPTPQSSSQAAIATSSIAMFSRNPLSRCRSSTTNASNIQAPRQAPPRPPRPDSLNTRSPLPHERPSYSPSLLPSPPPRHPGHTHKQQPHPAASETSVARTATTAGTRWSTNWAAEVEGRVGNEFYAERMRREREREQQGLKEGDVPSRRKSRSEGRRRERRG